MERIELIDQLAAKILTHNPGYPLRVAVDGVDAAGKTSLADELAKAMVGQNRAIIRASVDNFLNLKRVRRQQGIYSPKGFYEDSYNYPALAHDLLTPLGPGGNRQYRTAIYDNNNDKPLDLPYKTAPEDGILILDGIFLLRPELVHYWDLTIFVACDFEVTRARGAQRDAILYGSHAEAENRYHQRYIPGQQRYFLEAHPLDKAVIVIDNNILEEPFFIRFPGVL